MSTLVDIEARGPAAVITLRREDKLNALSSALERALSDALRDERVRGSACVVLAAACRAIQQRGFANTRIADIAAEADMSTGAIHYWFEVKDEVLIAALKWASAQLFDRLEQLAATADSERERLAQLLEHAVPMPGPRRGEYVLWIELWVRALQEPDLLPECEALSRRWRGYFFEAVRRGTEAGEFSPVSDPDDVAERLIAQVDGLGFELLLGYEWTSPERMRERLYGFAAEQVGIERRALERDARAVIAALDGEDR